MIVTKVLTKSFQTPPSNRTKRQSETSGDEETDHHATSLPAQRVTTSEQTAAEAKSTISEPIKGTGKKTAGSVSYHYQHTHTYKNTYNSYSLTILPSLSF